MGWKGYETTIPAGMIFRKMYCSHCADRLKRQKVTEIYKKGDDGYQNHVLGHATIGMDKIQIGTYIYICPSCGRTVTYDEQLKINKRQKKLNKKILSDDEIR